MIEPVFSYSDNEPLARSPFGGGIIIHATGAQTSGAFGIWETLVAPGAGPAPHIHTHETEIFRVIEGTFHVHCGDKEFDAPVGAVLVLPPRVEHAWRNVGDTMARMMGVVTPGGFEQMFVQIAALTAPTPASIAAVEKRFGIENEETRRLA